MARKLKFKERVLQLVEESAFPSALAEGLLRFYESYLNATRQNNGCPDDADATLVFFLSRVQEQLKNPYRFAPYHEKMTHPEDYYQLGQDFARHLIKRSESKISGLENADQISAQIARGENAILLSNHQTELDPQILSLMLEETHPRLAEDMIFVAGHRVVTDTLAVPFSLGRNLLCIYSKNYIDFPPEQKKDKVTHNQRTMKRLLELLSDGGKCIYVAPSGGRDRKNSLGTVDPSPFDPQSIEMFAFIAEHAKKPTHFYPLALATYALFPPPEKVLIALGEERIAHCCPVGISLGKELDMPHLPGSNLQDKLERRKARAYHIWTEVKNLYDSIMIKL